MKTNFKNLVSRMKRRDGFSLVELMIVVAIIGILAALAVPRFQQFQSKSRQSEARSNLAHIYTLQVSYNGDNDTFSNFQCLSQGSTSAFSNGLDGGQGTCGLSGAAAWAGGQNDCNTQNDLGFRISDCKKVRYKYTNIGDQNQFTATATELDDGDEQSRRVFPSCVVGPNDSWEINEAKNLYNHAPDSGRTALQGCNE